jgi:hypothetical protein
MRILLQASAGACLVAALMLGLAANSSGGSAGVATAGVATAGCQVPDYLATHSPGNRTPAGYYEYQTWIANEQAQTALDGLQSFVQSHFGLGPDSGDVEALARGLIGLALDDAAQTVDVVVDPSRVDQGELGRLAAAAVARKSPPSGPPFKVAVRGGCASAMTLADDRAFLDGLGSAVAPHGWGFYLDAHDSAYHVELSPQDASAAPVLTNRLRDRVKIRLSQVSLLDRLNDGQPHWGGAGIRPGNVSVNICTSAFVVNLPGGGLGAVTAGHCFVDTGTINNRNVFSGTQDYGGVTSGSSNYPNYDMVRINNGGQTWQPKIHVDPCCPDVRTVVASGNPAVGDFICNSGMTTRAICGLLVHAIDQTVCFSDGCRLHMIRADRNGDIVVRGGDSGGPMYNRFGTSDAAARGMIIGGGGCDANQRCTTAFGHRISAVTSHLSVTVATG